MTTNMRISKSGILLAFAGISFISLAACEKQRDEPPAQVALAEPTPPPAASAAEAPSPVPAPVPVPVRVGVAKGAPDGIVADGWVAGGKCNIEAVGGQSTAGSKSITLKSGVHATIAGWALDPTGKNIPDSVHVRFLSKDGDYYGTVSKRTVRDDVNGIHPVESKTVTSGFELEFDADQLPLGSYAVTTIMVSGDKTYICDNGRKVTRVQ